MSEFATTIQLQGNERRAVYIGIDARTAAHDYQKLHYLLLHYRAEKVSPRIWQVALSPHEQNLVVSLLRRCLAAGDDMLVADAPRAAVDQQRIAA